MKVLDFVNFVVKFQVLLAKDVVYPGLHLPWCLHSLRPTLVGELGCRTHRCRKCMDWPTKMIVTLWWFNIAMENGPFIEDFPRKKSIYGGCSIHVWYIYLQNWVIYGVNVGKYTIHGWSGIVNQLTTLKQQTFGHSQSSHWGYLRRAAQETGCAFTNEIDVCSCLVKHRKIPYPENSMALTRFHFVYVEAGID